MFPAANQVYKESTQVAPQVTPQVETLLSILKGELSRSELQRLLGLSDRKNFRNNYLLTIPDKPKSSKQKYRLTKRGKEARK